MNENQPPGTRDYTPCNLCGRPVNMERNAAQMTELCSRHPGMQDLLANTMQPIQPCDVCQERMQQQVSQVYQSRR